MEEDTSLQVLSVFCFSLVLKKIQKGQSILLQVAVTRANKIT